MTHSIDGIPYWELFLNRANLDEGRQQALLKLYPECLVFAMRDSGEHEFSLGLSTVLQCLHLAEKLKSVPPLPHWWWHTNKNYSLRLK
jgi:hypothetical protein